MKLKVGVLFEESSIEVLKQGCGSKENRCFNWWGKAEGQTGVGALCATAIVLVFSVPC